MNTRHYSIGLVFAMIVLCGCASVAPGHDAVVVRTESATVAAMEIVDTFLYFQHTNPVDLERIAPGATEAAENMRQHVPRALATVRALTKSYKHNRTPENKASMLTALAVLREAAAEAESYLAQWNKESLQ